MATAKAKTNNLRWVPFCAKTGTLREYAGYLRERLDLEDPSVRADQMSHEWYPTEWKLNYKFQDTLVFQGFSYGRSAGRACFKNSQGHVYGMFMSEFERLLLDSRMTGLNISGDWTFAKRGANYGLVEA